MSNISVCIATFNGEKFITEQLMSILRQLSPGDKCFLFDDNSQDKTIDLIREINDPKVILHCNRVNLGHVKNFEKVIRATSSDFIFLSDQDDIWTADKIAKVIRVFEENPGIAMVHHNLSKIDESGNILKKKVIAAHSGTQESAKFLINEFLKPRLFGCAMAFRKSVLNILLPFPGSVYAHDHWITIASLFVGKIYFLDEDLVLYRQHQKNVTPKKRRSFLSILNSRLAFACLVGHATIRFLFAHKNVY